MEYHVKVNDADNEYTDTHKNKWKLLTEKEMLERYPTGGFKIVGDLVNKKGQYDDYIILGDQRQGIKEYSGQIGKREYICGYIELEVEDCYVRVIKKKKSPLLGLLLLLMLVLSIFFAGIWLGQRDTEPYLDDTAIAYNVEGFENKDPNQILLPGIEEIHVQDNETNVEYALFNPKGNICNLQYIIKLTDSGEVIYTSKQVKPGYAVTKFDLTRTFAKGEYPITVEMISFDTKDGETRFNSGVMDAKLIVE